MYLELFVVLIIVEKNCNKYVEGCKENYKVNVSMKCD